MSRKRALMIHPLGLEASVHIEETLRKVDSNRIYQPLQTQTLFNSDNFHGKLRGIPISYTVQELSHNVDVICMLFNDELVDKKNSSFSLRHIHLVEQVVLAITSVNSDV